MKKILLLLCLIPILLPAQISDKELKLIGLTLQKNNGIVLKSAASDKLPDSTYTYRNDVLFRMLGLTYNGDGLIVLAQGYTHFNYADLIPFKMECAYAREGDLLISEAVTYMKPYSDNVWYPYARNVVYANKNDINVIDRLYYPDSHGGWELNQLSAAVEYNEKGNPTVMEDSISSTNNSLRVVQRTTVAYDESDRIAEYNTFLLNDKGEWAAYEHIEIAYNQHGYIENHYQYTDAGQPLFAYLREVLYDERGNPVSDTKKILDGKDYLIVTSDTYRHVYPSADAVARIQPGNSSVIYPNPSTDFVTVLLHDANQADIALYTMSGNLVAQQTIGNQSAISVRSLPEGIYLLIVKTEKRQDVHKLIVK